MAAKKGYSLEKGFLFDYGWLTMFRKLSEKDAWTLFMDLMEYQRSCGSKQIPEYPPKKEIMNMMAATICYQIDKRIKGAKVPTMVPTMVPTESRPIDDLINIEQEEEDRIYKYISPLTPPGGEVVSESKEYSRDFLIFWKQYPKKAGKAAAFEAWLKIAPSEDLADRILSAVRSQADSEQWKRENGRFIPSPAKWLREGRWEDELPAVSKTGGEGGGDSTFDTNDFFETALRASMESAEKQLYGDG